MITKLCTLPCTTRVFLLHTVTDMYVYAKGNGALGPNEPFVPEAALLAADFAEVGWFLMALRTLFFFYCMFPVVFVSRFDILSLV